MSNPSSSRRSSRNYDTGFPDAFAEYTTSLRHPEANVNPGACISAEDIDPSRTLHRTRRSFLAKHKRTISHGVISRDSDKRHGNNSTLALPTTDSAVDMGDLKHVDTNGSIGHSSKDGTESIDQIEVSINGDCSPSSPNEDDLTDDGRQGIKLFRKWLSQKD
ncbi:hypothetical protein F4776DRAFT_446139 [Hypoxylon sp. NC0597]|nr:hypothetical protein F4776DRAFT_446139 [Hypoxylon sp. NC0597]